MDDAQNVVDFMHRPPAAAGRTAAAQRNHPAREARGAPGLPPRETARLGGKIVECRR